MCLSKQCPRCGGDLFREQYPDDDTSFECLQCGWTSVNNHTQQVVFTRMPTYVHVVQQGGMKCPK